MDPFMHHVEACNNATLPGERVALLLGTEPEPVGWMPLAAAEVVRGVAGVTDRVDALRLADPAGLAAVAKALAAAGQGRIRRELFDVRVRPGGAVLGQVDRGMLPVLGIMSVGAHLNGLVRRADGLHLWVGHRSPTKQLDPNKLDNIVAGGVPAGLTPWQTLLKEAEEEASIPKELAARAVEVGRIGYAMQRDEGLRRDLLHCYDLELPESFAPTPGDDEISHFELWPIARAVAEVEKGVAFKFNVNLVLIDLFLRLGLIEGEQARTVRAAMPPA
jgi:thiamine pyrophosphokinase